MIFPTLWTVSTGGATPTILDNVGGVAAPATVVGGVAYTPVSGDRILVAFISGRLYILGKA